MNLSEISLLLGTVATYDGRVAVDEFKVRAWSESLDKDLAIEDARIYVYRHYGNFDTVINPSHINKYWRQHKNSILEKERGQQISKEFDLIKEKAAKPESVEKYLIEIRQHFRKVSDVGMEKDSGDLPSFEPGSPNLPNGGTAQ